MTEIDVPNARIGAKVIGQGKRSRSSVRQSAGLMVNS